MEKSFRPIYIWRLLTLIILGGFSIGSALVVAPTLFVLAPDRPGCDTPIHWSLGEVDERFPLSRKEFQTVAFQAEKIWEKALGKNLFVFDNSADFQIKTLFDERQEMTYAGQELDTTIEEYEKLSETLGQQYASLQSQYQAQKNEFDILQQAFQKDADAFAKTVSKWNKIGGVPADEYADLKKEQDSLNQRAATLNAMSSSINELVKKINRLADNANNQKDIVNTKIETFQEKYGEPKPFIQGLYEPPLNNISIFQFQDHNDLRLVLAHELGHALGIDGHVSSPSSLMFYLMGQQDLRNPKLSQEDIEAYAIACPPRNFSKPEKLQRYLILTPWQEMRLADLINILQ